jgi:hypothetical protein
MKANGKAKLLTSWQEVKETKEKDWSFIISL